MVKLADPKTLSIAHACLAQLCFGLPWPSCGYLPACPSPRRRQPCDGSAAGAGALFVQTILGAAVRHGAMAIVPHMLAPASPARWPCGRLQC